MRKSPLLLLSWEIGKFKNSRPQPSAPPIAAPQAKRLARQLSDRQRHGGRVREASDSLELRARLADGATTGAEDPAEEVIEMVLEMAKRGRANVRTAVEINTTYAYSAWRPPLGSHVRRGLHAFIMMRAIIKHQCERTAVKLRRLRIRTTFLYWKGMIVISDPFVAMASYSVNERDEG